MKKMKIIKGDLCYIPQDVTLLNELEKAPSEYIKTLKPQAAIVIDDFVTPTWIKVFFQGSQWYVSREQVYPMNEEGTNADQAHRNL
tara:strand:+ start:1391 stop:1648 length:258 start_codon:yes stop_codon:yes gene_type:complete